MSSVPKTRERRWLGRALPAASLVLVVVVSASIPVSYYAAEWRQARERAQWRADYGEVIDRAFEQASPDERARAREIERIAAAIGINVAPKNDPDAARPADATADAFWDLAEESFNWLFEELTRPEIDEHLPNPIAAQFLDLNARHLDSLRNLLADGLSPQWSPELVREFPESGKNLHGLVQLQRVLISDALLQNHRGSHRTAMRDLDASWNLNLPLHQSPFEIDHILANAIATYQVGALRRMEHVDPIWIERLESFDARTPVIESLALIGLRLAWYDGERIVTDSDGFGNDTPIFLMPVELWCLARGSEWWREKMRTLTDAESLCFADTSAAVFFQESESLLCGSSGPMPNMNSVLARTAKLELDIELTLQVLRSESEVPSAESISSSACPGERWIFSDAGRGSTSIQLEGSSDWSRISPWVLPTAVSWQASNEPKLKRSSM